MASILDKIMSFLISNEEESNQVKDKMRKILQEAVDDKDISDFTIVYANYNSKENYILVERTLYANYLIAFNKNTRELIIIDIDHKLSKHGEAVYLTKDIIKKGSYSKLFGYGIELKNKYSFSFVVPEVNSKLIVLFSDKELAIDQAEEAKSFNQFFKNYFNC